MIKAREVAFGASVAFGALLIASIVLAVVILYEHVFPRPYDSTEVAPARSGLRPLTDALTGCQYLATPNGITPRMGSDGKQICGRAQ